MIIRKAVSVDSKIIGRVHSIAWKQTYQNFFPKAYLEEDSPEKREKEFMEALNNKSISYLILEDNSEATGIVKLIFKQQTIEISSFYILEEFRGKGFGTQAFAFIKKLAADKTVILWVLENNSAARNFYEKMGMIFSGETRTINRGKDFIQYCYTSACMKSRS